MSVSAVAKGEKTDNLTDVVDLILNHFLFELVANNFKTLIDNIYSQRSDPDF